MITPPLCIFNTFEIQKFVKKWKNGEFCNKYENATPNYNNQDCFFGFNL